MSEVSERLAEVLAGHGARQGYNGLSRCSCGWEGPLGGIEGHRADALAERVEQMLAEARAEALREAADAVQGTVSYGFELRPDGSEDPTTAVYVEGLRDAWQIVKDRADAAEREAR